ncbi:hypothetical protein HUT16_27015 [Kitasatospora sp. NA04385]|uniref:hypothetical protein n=1 Tax=Kitasatospora sp. NA04385 TaxID=2742135 RepID=UPI00159234DA|nr:hypothetical protein [Kitasatospora sp. NA04385]QKW22237.1 hypothetical protein HUT16_27015 [Kitasatospora sp. NA04385]
MGFLAERRARQAGNRAAVAAAGARQQAGQETDRLTAEGRAQRRAGAREAAAATLAEAARLGTDLLGPDDPRTLLAGSEHGRTLMLLRRWAEAEQALRAVADAAAPHPDQRRLALRLDALGALGAVLLRHGRPAAAAAVLEEHRELARQLEYDLAGSLSAEDLADAYVLLARGAEAVHLYADTAAHREAGAAAGRSDAAVLRLRAKLARALLLLGHHVQAERAARAVLGAAADDPAGTGRWMAAAALSRALVLQDRAAEGEAVAREAAAWPRAGGPESALPLRIGHALAAALNAQQRHREALELVLAQLAVRAAAAGPAGTAGPADASAAPGGEPGETGEAATVYHYDLAAALLGLGRPEEARQAVEGLVAHCRAALAPHDHTGLVVGTLYGRVLAALGRTEEARSELAANVAAWREGYGPEHVRTLAAERALAAVREPDEG